MEKGAMENRSVAEENIAGAGDEQRGRHAFEVGIERR
jgi:hypothetical protein